MTVFSFSRIRSNSIVQHIKAMSTQTNLKRKRSSAASTQAGVSGTVDLGRGAVVKYLPRFFDREAATDLFNRLKTEVNWQEKEITVMGRKVMQPRLVAYEADNEQLSYTYSRTKMIPDSWHGAVQEVKEKLEKEFGYKFNSCLLNLYRHGNDSMGWHSDNEVEYGKEPIIASVSFGAPRDFLLRKNTDHTQKWSYPLGSGDVLIMEGTCQDHFMHAIPKRKKVEGERINLTFRTVLLNKQ